MYFYFCKTSIKVFISGSKFIFICSWLYYIHQCRSYLNPGDCTCCHGASVCIEAKGKIHPKQPAQLPLSLNAHCFCLLFFLLSFFFFLGHWRIIIFWCISPTVQEVQCVSIYSQWKQPCLYWAPPTNTWDRQGVFPWVISKTGSRQRLDYSLINHNAKRNLKRKNWVGSVPMPRGPHDEAQHYHLLICSQIFKNITEMLTSSFLF